MLEKLQKAVSGQVQTSPPAIAFEWSGQFEYLGARPPPGWKIVVPITLVVIFLLLYLNFGTPHRKP